MSHRSLVAAVILLLGSFGQFACAKEDSESLLTNSQGAGAGSGKTDSASGASCKNGCEGSSEDGSCWCDPTCEQFGDCCADYDSQLCSGTEPVTGGSGGGGGASGGTGGGAGGTTGGSGGVGGTKPATGGTGGIGGVGGAGFGGTTGNPNSCFGHCGAQSVSGACYCDPDCQFNGDCCPDVAQACGGGVGGGTSTGGGCTPALCVSEQPATQNGVECYCDPTCMMWGDCCPNKPQICGI